MLKIVNDIRIQKTEKQNIELKSAHYGCPTRLFDSLSSFSNQDSGGIIIFGIDEDNDYNIAGVYDAQDLQKKVNEQCKQMEPLVRALFTVCEIEGKIVVSAEIPGTDITQRLVFYKGAGRINGSYIRVGESDERMSEYEIYSYEAFRKRIRDDIRTLDNVSSNILNKNMLDNYLNDVKKERKNLSSDVSDEEILECMGVLNDGKPTLSGILNFSKYPQGYFPQLCINAVVVPGTEIGDLGDDGERFIDNERITGTIAEMLDSAVDFVRRNSRTKTVINEFGKREDKNEYPVKAVREAILNALVHRDYSIHTESIPIRIEMYRDRMEIINSGGLYGKITVDSLGKVRPDTRNAVLANILEILHVSEHRYSGIPTIRKELKDAGLPEPVFIVKNGEFKVILRNSIYEDRKTGNLKEDILKFCETPRSRAELIEFLGMSRYYVMSSIIQPLVETGELKLLLPEKPKSSKQRYMKSSIL